MTPERFDRLTAALHKRQNDLAVVLVNIEDPRNVAAVMRSCDAVGIQDIYVLNTIEKRERNWKFRSSRSAEKWISMHFFDDADACFTELKAQYNKVFSTCLSEDAVDLYAMDFTQSMALVFGNERKGLSADVLKYCDGNFVIPQVGVVQSLNISVACAVTIYEAYRQRKVAGLYEKISLPEPKLTALKKLWMDIE